MKKLLFALATVACTMVGNNASAQTDPLLASILKIVSPVEVSNLIREQGIAYNKGILNKPENTLKYTSPYKQSLNLGIFSTDLGYATINDQNMDALTYLTQVRTTATALKVEKFINTGKVNKVIREWVDPHRNRTSWYDAELRREMGL
jgi:hypothetical protein